MRRPRRSRAGLTLVELMVSVGISVLVLLGAVGLAHHEVRMMGISQDVLEMTQSGRVGLDLLADDLANSGLGVGYDEAGVFRGLESAAFTRGGAGFTPQNQLLALTAQPNTPTDDIGIMSADGPSASIVGWFPPNAFRVCQPSEIDVGDIVLLRSQDGLSARTVRATVVSPLAVAAGCGAGVECQNGCADVSFAADSSYVSSPAAAAESYDGGYAASDFKQITWFVEAVDPANPGVGRLRRAIGTCAARNQACGDVVADNVEAIQTRVYSLDAGVWTDVTGLALDRGNRLRVDIELVLRARVADSTGQLHEPVRFVLEPWCIPGGAVALPGNCPANRDAVRRMVMRASVELRNAGRMRFSEGGG